MLAFRISKGVIDELNRIKKRFMWHGHKEYQVSSKPIHLIYWTTSLMPKEAGGLGVRHLSLTNISLLMKWMWAWHTSADT
jgi:hypothetical protein